ncbi:MAG: YlxR family protein [Calditrichaeota bacterium]|nr:YlxR family protein [Calditrichota bacterium]
MALPNWYRRCVGCGAGRDKREMLRVVKNKDQPPEPDLQQRKPGRGAYVCPSSQCVTLAKKKRGLERSFRCAFDDQIYEKLIQQVKTVENGKS